MLSQKPQAAPGGPPEDLMKALDKIPLSTALQQNLDLLHQVFRNCSDVIFHSITPSQGGRGCLIFTGGLVDRLLINQHVIDPLLQGEMASTAQQVAARITAVGETKEVSTAGAVADHILRGRGVLLIDGSATALGLVVPGWPVRAVSEPAVESTIRGPRESFVETVRQNTALVRRRIKTPALKMEMVTLGRLTGTDVVIAYIEGLASPDLVAEVRRRVKAVDIDSILDEGQLEQFIEDSPFSPFPQVMNTERPDTVAANLLEGRVALLVDGSPFALVVPAVLNQLMQAAEDYYERFIGASTIRLLRYLFITVALLLPSVYVAITTFHQEMVPTDLLLSIAAAREGVPFPAIVEALSMEVSFEILREAGIRLPRPVGQAISIVGALVVGEAAVRAGIVSPSMVIVVAITGISSFAIPKYSAGLAIRVLRFPLMFLGASLGLFGVMAGFSAILLHLCSLRSFGVPYLAPLAPMSPQGLKDMLIRGPLWWNRLRPKQTAKRNRTRMSDRAGSG